MSPKSYRTKEVVTSAVVALMFLLSLPAWSISSESSRMSLLIQQLKDEHWQGRRDAAVAMGQSQPARKAEIGALAEALKDQDSRVRRAAAEALGKAGAKGKGAVPALIAALGDPDAPTRQSAAKALGRIAPKGRVAVSALARMVEDADPHVRESAAVALGEFQANRRVAIPALRKALADRSGDVRSAAAAALGEIGANESVPDLIEKLKDEQPAVRRSSAQALGKIGKPAIPGLMNTLRSDNPGFLQAVVEALGEIGPPAADELVKVLKDPSQNPQVRQYSALALARVARGSNEVVHALMDAVADPNSSIRLSAIDALARIGPDAAAAIDPLIKELKDQSEDPIVRQHAAHALARIGPEQSEVTEALTGALDSGDPKVEGAVVSALVETKVATKQDENTVRTLHDLTSQLSAGSATTRRSAIEALGRLGPRAQAAVPSLVEVLSSKQEEAEIRQEAAAAIGSIGPFARSAVAPLIELLKNEQENPEARASAIEALGQIGPAAREALPALIQTVRQGDPQLRPLALLAMERIGPAPKSPIPAFKEAVSSASLEARGSAALSMQDFVKVRAQQWVPLLSQAEAPVLRSWVARSKDLYGVDASESLQQPKTVEGRNLDAFTVLGGRAAVRESLQLQLIGDTSQSRDEARTIQVGDIPGVRTRSHPFDRMLADSNRELAQVPLADLAPPDHFFADFSSVSALNEFLGGGLDFLSRLGTIVSASSVDYELRARYQTALGLTESQLEGLDKSGLVKEIAVISPDLFFADGTELVVIVRLNSQESLERALGLLGLVRTGASAITAREVGPGRKAYWSALDDSICFSTNLQELEKALALRQRGSRESLGQSAEFRYMLGQLPPQKETQAYFYFSDPFLRNLVGPATKIGQLRRMQARAELEMLTAGALLYKLDGNPGAPALNRLAELGYVPRTFLRRDFTVHDNFVAESRKYGTPAHLKPLIENPIDRVSNEEAKAYAAYLENYSKFWSQYFDPIAMRLDSSDGYNFELTTFILPLLDSELYNQLRQVVIPATERTPLKVPALRPEPVLMLSLNVSDATRLRLTGQLADTLVRYTAVDPKIMDSFGSGVHLAILDSEPIVALGSGDILGALGGQDMMGPDLKSDQLIPLLLSVLTRPCKLLIELQDPGPVLDFLRQASLHRSLTGGEGELYQVKGKDAWIYQVNIEKMIQLYLGVTVENGYLVISNFPWSQQGTVATSSPSALNGALLQLDFAEVRQQLPALHTKVYGDYRKDAIAGMGYLYPMLASGYATSVQDGIAKHSTLFGFKPVHPPGGSWLWENGQLKSSMFGTAECPVQPEFESGNPDFGLFQNFQRVTVNMQFEDAGLRTQVRWRVRAEPTPPREEPVALRGQDQAGR
jgi:HEAT repeat protein